MSFSRDPLRVALILLLLASAVIFAVGTSIERGRSGETLHETTTSSNEGTSESSGEGSATESHPAATESSGETIFGINPDASWLVAVVVAITVLLAAAVWARQERWLLLAVILFGLVAAAFDLRELIHQMDVGRASLIALASVLAAVHLGVSGLAAATVRRERRVIASA
jgi:hypothetical protein